MNLKTSIIIIGAIMTILAMLSCEGRSENRKIKQAANIHEKMMIRHDSIYSKLVEQKNRVDKKLSRLTDVDPDYPAYKSMWKSLDRGFNLLNSWNASVVEVPGMEHNHNEGTHNHNHSKENEDLKHLSDQEILDLQQAYASRLDEVDLKIRELITTMDMYTKDVQ